MFKILLLSAFLASVANAKPSYMSILGSGFPQGKLNVVRCQNCHSSQNLSMNLFGQDFVQIRKNVGADNIKLVWEQIRDLDSDKDGLTNLEEINEGRNPGVAGK
ncbi:MAG: hypothetical protein ACK5WZ_13550 [Pseudobdellovibrionaceae bacterium]